MLIVFLLSLHAVAMTVSSAMMRNTVSEVPLVGGCKAICTTQEGGCEAICTPQIPAHILFCCVNGRSFGGMSGR